MFARIKRRRGRGAEIYRRRARLNTGSKRRNELPTNRLPAIPLFYIPCWAEARRREAAPFILFFLTSVGKTTTGPFAQSDRPLILPLILPTTDPSFVFFPPLSTSPLKTVAPSGAARFSSRFAYHDSARANESI